ncbi:hypothetical protein [Alteromonas australica]|jgi:hypothetical protein|uniref:hypothetical protein n=2 Tax=Gammaproteobacteria TaxID=1236 RepID=UPI00235545F3|nr:hypothetical protein [Alteromonas australica]|tara:strand:- start:118 stop:1032 length:915 start_codon:yes stop_codon:yes gene_type:complete
MDTTMPSGFYDNGITQGCVIPLTIFDDTQKQAILDALPRKKHRPKIGIVKDANFAVVLTQECDLNAPPQHQPTIELAIAKPAKRKDERLILAKNLHKIHVLHDDIGYIELESDLIVQLEKAEFQQAIIEARDSVISSNHNFKNLIIKWRLLSYAREPFPHKVNQLIKTTINDSEDTRLHDLLTGNTAIDKLVAYVFPENEDAEHYYLALSLLLYEVDDDAKEDIASEFYSILEDLHGKSDRVTILNVADNLIDAPEEVVEVDIYPEPAFRPSDIQLSDFFKYREYNVEYLCYSDDSGERIDEED